MENVFYFTILACATGIGFYLAFLYGKKTKYFHWIEYWLMAIWPIFSAIYLSFVFGYKIFLMFLLSALMGFAAELILGYSYHKILNKKLWIYQRMSLDGYSSYLSIPFWGNAGLFFWLIAKMINL